MIELLIMRHAKSDWSVGAADFQRPLNRRGERAAEQMATWLADQDLHPDRVLSSSAVRARTTAEAVVSACAVDSSAVNFDDELYLTDVATWMKFLAAQVHDRVLICGHNFGLDDLVEHLSSTPPPLSQSGKLMTTAAIAHLRFDCSWKDVSAGSGELVQLVRPRELADPQT